jgi:hypothetical protein
MNTATIAHWMIPNPLDISVSLPTPLSVDQHLNDAVAAACTFNESLQVGAFGHRARSVCRLVISLFDRVGDLANLIDVTVCAAL